MQPCTRMRRAHPSETDAPARREATVDPGWGATAHRDDTRVLSTGAPPELTGTAV